MKDSEIFASPWATLGDSFAAGPGTGPPFNELPADCFRNNGSYPVQLYEDFPLGSNVWQFLACTGDVVDNMINDWIPSLNEDQQLLTVSIGGNDFGFRKILRACVFKPGGSISDDCDTTIKATNTYLDNEFENTLRKGYDAIFDKIPKDYKREVFLNILADRVRDVMKGIIERFSADKERQPGSGGNDSPPTVSGQEISEQYDAKTCADDPRSHTDFAFGWGCESARYVATVDSNDSDFKTYAPEYVIKAFPPKDGRVHGHQIRPQGCHPPTRLAARVRD
ncbi:hypothetical protein DL768_007972 [Monosporascus sp. mg162]|nr:hypothetical protein DL768_007972 [Monosporascus sp. mg162]